MFSEKLLGKAQILSDLLKKNKLMLSTAESCTGGLISALITSLPGSSCIYDRGFVTYSNKSKVDLLTVPTFFLEEYSAVSKETAIAMAEGALLMSNSDLAISVTGVAGPDGGSPKKPVGTVFLGYAQKTKKSLYKSFNFSGNRNEIRILTVENAIDFLILQLDN